MTALYELDGVADIRPTCDVDCVVDVTTAFAYYAFIDRLRARGFSECTDDRAPLCRHICGDIRVDLMPAADTPIGPSNRWYPEAHQHPVRYAEHRGDRLPRRRQHPVDPAGHDQGSLRL